MQSSDVFELAMRGIIILVLAGFYYQIHKLVNVFKTYLLDKQDVCSRCPYQDSDICRWEGEKCYMLDGRKKGGKS